MNFVPQVLVDGSRPLLIFRKGRTKFHAIAARESDIALVELDTLRGLRPLMHHEEPYPPKRCASFWLNHDFRPITKRAQAVLRGLVARKPKAAAAGTRP